MLAFSVVCSTDREAPLAIIISLLFPQGTLGRKTSTSSVVIAALPPICQARYFHSVYSTSLATSKIILSFNPDSQIPTVSTHENPSNHTPAFYTTLHLLLFLILSPCAPRNSLLMRLVLTLLFILSPWPPWIAFHFSIRAFDPVAFRTLHTFFWPWVPWNAIPRIPRIDSRGWGALTLF